ncbi:MAG TPA: DUF6308 family protein [Gemmatimonadaceae bacterium]|nr:DUF6308 family protein [Gemmatimonadaceae bacterium]
MTKIATDVRIPWVLTAGYEPVASRLLQIYFGQAGLGPAFDGALFQAIGGRGDAEEWKDVVRAEDALAVSALSVDVPPAAAHALLGDKARDVARLLSRIPADVDLASDDADVSADSPASALWQVLRHEVGLGPTTTSKLMARKRPRLIPIYDSVVRDVLGLTDSRGHWAGMRAALRANDCELHHRAGSLRASAALDPETVSVLRVLDVVLWMHGKKPERSAQIAAELHLTVPRDHGD